MAPGTVSSKNPYMYSYKLNRLYSTLSVLLISFLLGGCCNDKKAKEAIDNLYSSDVSERNDAALTLAGCGRKAESAVPRLIELLHDDNIGMQSSAAFALRKIDTEEAREALERK